MAILAEQDNQVQILSGTAAVCACKQTLGENRSLRETLGRLRLWKKSCNPLFLGMNQKTYEADFLRSLRVMGSAFVAEKRLRHSIVSAAAIFFMEVKIMKKLLAMILALALVLSLAGCVTNLTPDPTAPAKPGDGEEKSQFTVVVTHKDQTEKSFLYEVVPGSLGDALEAAGLIVSEGADDGMFHTVDGEKADWNTDQSYWAFYVENDYAMTGIYDTPIESGRTYKLVYTIG